MSSALVTAYEKVGARLESNSRRKSHGIERGRRELGGLGASAIAPEREGDGLTAAPNSKVEHWH